MEGEEDIKQSIDKTAESKNVKITSNAKSYKAPDDYKFHCFDDKIFSETIIDRGINTRCIFFDEHWNPTDIKITYPIAQKKIEKPEVLGLMIDICREFRGDLGYLRCDFYLQENKILHIGELTFTPGGGVLPIAPREWDGKLGELWNRRFSK